MAKDYYDCKDEIQEIIESLYESDAIEIWNEFCDKEHRGDEKIMEMYLLDDLLEGSTPREILDSVSDEFSTDDEFIRYTIWGFESTCDATEWIYADEVAKYCMENDYDFGNDEIREKLDEYNSDEEEDEEEED